MNLPKVGDTIGWWPYGHSFSEVVHDSEREVTLSLAVPGTQLHVIATKVAACADENIFLVRDGRRIGLGTWPSQCCLDMHFEFATEHSIGCNDLLPGELDALRALYEANKHLLPEV